MSLNSDSVPLLKKGSRLGGRWTIQSLVGEGGCGQIYSLEESDPVHGQLVAKCVALPSNTHKKNTAKERGLVNIANSLYYEWLLCRQKFQHLSFVPPGPTEDYGEDLGCRYFIMKRLSYDLSRRPAQIGSVTLPTVCDIGVHILSGLNQLHTLGYLFVDVSPSNFMIDRKAVQKDMYFNDDLDKLYFIDFGLVEKYTEYMLSKLMYSTAILYFLSSKLIRAVFFDADNGQRENTHRVAPAGAPRYTSIAVQQGETPSRRDDLESLVYLRVLPLFVTTCGLILIFSMQGYVLLELCSLNNLPWHDGVSNLDIISLKQNTNISQLAMSLGCPEVINCRRLFRYNNYNFLC